MARVESQPLQDGKQHWIHRVIEAGAYHRPISPPGLCRRRFLPGAQSDMDAGFLVGLDVRRLTQSQALAYIVSMIRKNLL